MPPDRTINQSNTKTQIHARKDPDSQRVKLRPEAGPSQLNHVQHHAQIHDGLMTKEFQHSSQPCVHECMIVHDGRTDGRTLGRTDGRTDARSFILLDPS